MRSVLRWAAALTIAAAFGGGAARAGDFRDTPEAVRTQYRAGVPHTTRTGEPLLVYDPARSHFPVGLYNVLTGIRHGLDHRGDFVRFKNAGFNTVFAWGGQPLEEVLADAAKVGLQVSWQDPSDAQVARMRDHPNVIGYNIDHEPSLLKPGPEAEARLAAFATRAAAIRALDPGRPVFTVDSPSISGERRENWIRWKRAGDIAAVWKYPYFDPPVEFLTGPRGLPEVITLAVEAMAGRAVWHVAQAFESPLLDWYMPDAREARAMVYAALVHGATGIIWFAHDNYASRNGLVLGASPAPAFDYGVEERPADIKSPPLLAGEKARARSRHMWRVVVALNAELAALGPTVLSPTAAVPYRVAVRGASVSEAPIRTLLKQVGDHVVLMAVNVDRRPLDARFDFGAANGTGSRVVGLVRLHDRRQPPVPKGGVWTERFEPFGVRVSRFTLKDAPPGG